MTATVIPEAELARRRAERERQRQQDEALKGSILDEPCAPASPAQQKETRP
jgi:hypothetical protein